MTVCDSEILSNLGTRTLWILYVNVYAVCVINIDAKPKCAQQLTVNH